MNLEELKAQCQALNLNVQRSGKREAKLDYVLALQAHFAQRDYPAGIPYTELNPMLCFNYWELSQREQKIIWQDDNNWIAQRKLNGVRLIVHFVAGVGTFAHSRATSEATFRRSLLTDRLLFHDHVPNFTATIDAEALSESPGKSSLQTTTSVLHAKQGLSIRLQVESKLTIHVFDITRWNEFDLRIRPLCERLAFLADFKAAIGEADLQQHFDFPPSQFLKKKAYFDGVIASGGEGVVLKNLNSPYIDSNARSRTGWVKVKRQQELDCYVSAFDRGKPGSRLSRSVSALHFSVQTDQGPRCVAKVSNFSRDLRRLATVYDRDADTVRLNPQLYGKVARVSGMEFSGRSLRLLHASIVHWRDDRKQEDCRYNTDNLRALK